MDAIETFRVGAMTVKIYPDEDAPNPRTEYDEASKMVCWHRRYKLGDEHSYKTPQDFEEERESLDIAIIKPLFLYDHSGITIRTHSFNDHWDSGQVGWVYMTKADVDKECGGDLERADKLIEAEVRTYDLFLTGQVYGFDVLCDGTSFESCWGIFDLDYAREEAISAAERCDTERTERILANWVC